jgi:hypothetical protein
VEDYTDGVTLARAQGTPYPKQDRNALLLHRLAEGDTDGAMIATHDIWVNLG